MKETLLLILDYSISATLFMSLLQVYLRVNKIWKRKHEQEVADSQSILGLTLLLINCALWIVYYAVNDDVKSIFDTSIIVFETMIFALISTGFWVKGSKGLGFMSLIKKAFSAERKEADYLLNKFFKPSNAGVIIDILHQLAMIDDYLDPKEQELIETFSKEWGIKYDIEELNKNRYSSEEGNYIRLRKSVEDYLATQPDKEQAAQLKDMMQTMIEADDEITQEEELISSELMGLIENFIKDSDEIDAFHVMIVPQNQEHHDSIKAMMPEATIYNIAGGMAYSVGKFYSMKYAEMICDQYRQEKLFTIVHHPLVKIDQNSDESDQK
ncbi:hypothetical protein OAQ99_01950 [Candidatus Kapabacteria bacterium]|nr:hypothetical protein [Candidatus Kapabacteria bacterium]